MAVQSRVGRGGLAVVRIALQHGISRAMDARGDSVAIIEARARPANYRFGRATHPFGRGAAYALLPIRSARDYPTRE
jgi:hypothetical protein